MFDVQSVVRHGFNGIDSIRYLTTKAILLGPALAPLAGGKRLSAENSPIKYDFFLGRDRGALLFMAHYAARAGLLGSSCVCLDIFIFSGDESSWSERSGEDRSCKTTDVETCYT